MAKTQASRESAFYHLNSENAIINSTAIVFSASLEARNYLRSRIHACGFNAVCFEKEAVCFDNVEPIQPAVVIVKTEDAEVVWRFIFALYASSSTAPLVIVSDRLKADRFFSHGFNLHIHFVQAEPEEALAGQLRQIVNGAAISGGSAETFHLPVLIGQSEPINAIRSILPSIAGARDSVLITGEAGTGKEMLVRLIVGLAPQENSFIKIECRNLEPEMLIRDWYHTLLDIKREGVPVTIFLCHLDQMAPASQAETLLVIEGLQETGNNGASARMDGAIRFLSTSDRPIEGLVESGAFRKDLFYRLNVIAIAMPALRYRKDDIPLLMDYFTIHECAKIGKCNMVPSARARELLHMHDWPGNVDELKKQMVRVAGAGSESCLFANTQLLKLAECIKTSPFQLSGEDELPECHEIKEQMPDLSDISLKNICDDFVARTEQRLMKRALEFTNWNRKKAAQLLNISYKSMLNKMKVYDII